MRFEADAIQRMTLSQQTLRQFQESERFVVHRLDVVVVDVKLDVWSCSSSVVELVSSQHNHH